MLLCLKFISRPEYFDSDSTGDSGEDFDLDEASVIEAIFDSDDDSLTDWDDPYDSWDGAGLGGSEYYDSDEDNCTVQ